MSFFSKKILLVIDTALSENSFGLTRTLINFLKNYPPDHLIQVPIDTLHQHVPSLNNALLNFKTPKNRCGIFLSKLKNFLRLTYLKNTSIQYVLSGKPDIIFICGSNLETLVYGDTIRRKSNLPTVTYFMDDPRSLDKTTWFGGSGKNVIGSLISFSKGVIFISDKLEQQMCEHYQCKSNHFFIAHNPVDHTQFPWAALSDTKKNELKIVYTGSLWGMHRDALFRVALTISGLAKTGLCLSFSIFTNSLDHEEFQNLSAVSLHEAVEYEKFPQLLEKYTLCVVPSSFSKESHHLVTASLQTKLTDYMAAGRPLLAFGPHDAACNLFVNHHAAGFSISSEQELEGLLRTLLDNQGDLRTIGEKNRTLLEKKFSLEIIQPAFLKFLSECSEPLF